MRSIFPQLVGYPIEQVAIDLLYPNVVAFGASAGQTNQDFYLTSIEERNAFANAAAPTALSDQTDLSCIPGQCSQDSHCDDGAFCNGSEVCSENGFCVAGVAPEVDDGVDCTADSCDEANDVVVHDRETLCGDGNICNGVETCNVTADTCEAGIPLAADDGIACTDDGCDPASGVFNIPSDFLCGDGKFCNGNEVCSSSSGCLAGSPPAIDDGIACTIDSCDETNDIVVHDASMCGGG